MSESGLSTLIDKRDLTLSFPNKTSDKDDLCQDPLSFLTLRRHGPRL